MKQTTKYISNLEVYNDTFLIFYTFKKLTSDTYPDCSDMYDYYLNIFYQQQNMKYIMANLP